MADDSTDSAATEDKVQDVDVIGSKDWFLQSIIGVAVSSGVEIGVTLTIGGSIVSGTLISGATYFKELGEKLQSEPEGEHGIKHILGKGWSEYQNIYQKPSDAEEDWETPKANYLHLRNARYFAPGQQSLPRDVGFLWRGKLSAVDAFALGALSAD